MRQCDTVHTIRRLKLGRISLDLKATGTLKTNRLIDAVMPPQAAQCLTSFSKTLTLGPTINWSQSGRHSKQCVSSDHDSEWCNRKKLETKPVLEVPEHLYHRGAEPKDELCHTMCYNRLQFLSDDYSDRLLYSWGNAICLPLYWFMEGVLKTSSLIAFHAPFKIKDAFSKEVRLVCYDEGSWNGRDSSHLPGANCMMITRHSRSAEHGICLITQNHLARRVAKMHYRFEVRSFVARVYQGWVLAWTQYWVFHLNILDYCTA